MASKRTRKKLILALVAVALLGGVGYGAKVLWSRGKARETVRQRAERAFRQEKFVLAADLSREVLKSEPDSVPMRRMLLAALWGSEQHEAAETAARRYFEEGPEHAYAARTLYRAHLLRNDLTGAEGVARRIADTDEEMAYYMMARLRDLGGVLELDVRQRLEAAAYARNLKPVTERESAQAEALILAATINREVADVHPRKEAMLRVVRRDLKDAEPLAAKAAQIERSYERRLALGRIRILSADESVAEDGARLLRRYVSGQDRSEHAMLALVSYHARKGEWTEAMDLLREIKDPYLWMRAFWVIRATGDIEAALRALDMCPFAEDEAVLWRAEALVQLGKDEETQSKGRAILEEVVADGKADPARVRRALLFLAVRVDFDAAREAARKANLAERDDPALQGLVAALLMASAEERDEGLAMIRELAGSGRGNEREIMGALGALGGRSVVESYLDEQIAAGGEHAFQYRLRRAVTNLAEAQAKRGTPAEKEMRAKIRRDLEVLLEEDDAPKLTYAGAFTVAVRIGDVELAGRCAARAIVLPGPPEMMDLRILGEIVKVPADSDAPARLAAGIRREIDGLKAKAYLRALADTIEDRVTDLEKLAVTMEKAGEEKASALPAYELGAIAHLSRGALDDAIRVAREALQEDNESRLALEVLGRVYLVRERYEDVLTLWSGFDEMPEGGYPQAVGALMGLDRKDEALATAREMLAKHPGPLAHVLLATVYREREEPRKALSILNMAPRTRLIEYQRAELLYRLKDYAVAENIYRQLLHTSRPRFSELQAWVGFRSVLTATDRDPEFLEATAKVLDAPKLELDAKLRAQLRHMRGAVLESRGDIPEALAEYERAIELDGDDWQSLNNAAWHIAQLRPRRIDEAQDYIERALKAAPESATLRDTAAELHSKRGEHDEALEDIELAVEMAPRHKKAKYLVHKARILMRADRKPEAEKLLRRVQEEWKGDPALKAAERALWEIVGERERERREEEARKAAEEAERKAKQGAADPKDASAADGD